MLVNKKQAQDYYKTNIMHTQIFNDFSLGKPFAIIGTWMNIFTIV
jgi:hypothetical protein